MAKKDKEVKEIPVDYRIVLYTDGGCVPNPGNAGYGVHGYSYRETGVNINRFRLLSERQPLATPLTTMSKKKPESMR